MHAFSKDLKGANTCDPSEYTTEYMRMAVAAIMKEMAQEYGFAYETATADIDEQALGNRQHSPAALVELLAQAKADAIIGKLCQSESAPLQGYLLTCDQVVVYQNVIREKPVSQEQVTCCSPCLHQSAHNGTHATNLALTGALYFRLRSFLPATPTARLVQ